MNDGVRSVALTELKAIALVNTLRSCQLFTGLPSADLENIAAITVVKALDKDTYLFHEGDPAQGFYIVQRGAVNVHRVSAAGKEQVIHIFRTGDSNALERLSRSGFTQVMIIDDPLIVNTE